jgi:DNA-binding CsgD family transcriptional regulator
MRTSVKGTAFVGRADELATLMDSAARAAEGATVWANVCASPGLGKSALLDEALRLLQNDSSNAWVARTRPDATRRLPPYGTLEPLVRSLLQAVGTSAGETSSPGLAAIAPHLGTEDDRALLRRLELGRVEQAVDAFLGGLVRAATARALVVLAVDDIHQADEQSLRALGRLFAGQDRCALLILTAQRPPEIDANATLDAVVDRASRSSRFVEVSLGPLTPDESRELAGRLAGRLAERLAISDVDVESVAKAGGNPLVIRWIAGGLGSLDVSRFVRLALSTLNDRQRESVYALAVYGRPLPAAKLRAVTGIGPTSDLVASLCRRALLRVEEHAIGFFHDLVREEIISQLDDAERARLHALLARRLIESNVTDPSRRDLDIGFHLRRSNDAADRRAALEYSFRAAEQAEAAGAWEDALAVWRDTRARLPDEDALIRADVELGIGRCLLFKPVAYPSRYEGQTLVAKATRTYIESGDPERMVAAAGKRNSLIEFDLVDAWERAAEMIPRDYPGASIVRYRRAWNRFFVFPDLDYVRRGMEEVREALRDGDPDWVALGAEAALLLLRFWKGETTSVAKLEELLPRIRASADAVDRIWWLKQVASTLRRLGHIERADSVAHEALREAESARGIDANFATLAQSLIQRLALARGDFEEAIRLGELETTMTRVPAILALYYTGRVSEGDELVHELLPGLENDPSHWLPIANCLVHTLTVRAICTGESYLMDRVDALSKELAALPPFNPLVGLQITTGIIRAAFLRRDTDLLARVEPRIDAFRAIHARFDGHLLLRARARCAWGLGRRSEARSFYSDALTWCDHYHDATMRAWTHFDLARLHDEDDDEAEARRQMEKALAVARRIGLVALMERAADAPPTGRIARLTRREREVLALLAEGYADKEIGAKLGVSTFTASNHVRHIREKLRCASRAEAAAMGLRMGIVE